MREQVEVGEREDEAAHRKGPERGRIGGRGRRLEEQVVRNTDIA